MVRFGPFGPSTAQVASRRAIAVLLVLVVGTACSACGNAASSSKSSKDHPLTARQTRALFVQSCGSCHSLKDAGTHGSFGPNLDELQPDRTDVRDQIRHGGGGMPQGLLVGADADSVADYVAAVAGR